MRGAPASPSSAATIAATARSCSGSSAAARRGAARPDSPGRAPHARAAGRRSGRAPPAAAGPGGRRRPRRPAPPPTSRPAPQRLEHRPLLRPEPPAAAQRLLAGGSDLGPQLGPRADPLPAGPGPRRQHQLQAARGRRAVLAGDPEAEPDELRRGARLERLDRLGEPLRRQLGGLGELDDDAEQRAAARTAPGRRCRPRAPPSPPAGGSRTGPRRARAVVSGSTLAITRPRYGERRTARISCAGDGASTSAPASR